MDDSKQFVPVADADLGERERAYLIEAFDSGRISGSGPFVDRFEAAFANFIGVRHAITCANGTVALHLALDALGIGPGDEVIIPSLTYIATANAVTYCGAKPVFADSDLATWNMSADNIEPLVTPKTKAIVVVPLYGNPVDMDPIMALAQVHGIRVIEDAAEAHGATYKGKRVGSLADVATFSFYGNKLMTTGEGGMVVTDDAALADRMRLLRGQGMDPKRRYWFPVIGYNYRLTNLQCAIGLGQLERLTSFIDTRKRLASRYQDLLGGLDGVSFQTERAPGESVWWMFSVRFKDQATRDRVTDALATEQIETRPLFFPLHTLPPYQSSPANCPNADAVALSGLNLPSGGHVSGTTIERIRDIMANTIS